MSLKIYVRDKKGELMYYMYTYIIYYTNQTTL